MNNWWHDIKNDKPERVVLFQVDIKNHTKWLIEQEYPQQAYLARKQLAESITSALLPLDYHRMFWAGDGGTFAARLKDRYPENVCEAADAAMKAFRDWTRLEVEREKQVDFRITATLLSLIIDSEPGYWCGLGLNDFLKYEREIAITGGFVITKELRELLNDEKCRARFPQSHEVYFGGNKVKCYADIQYVVKRIQSARSFGGWLRRNLDFMPVDAKHPDQKAIRLDGNMFISHDSTILDTAFEVEGYRAEVLDFVDTPLEAKFDNDADQLKWQKNIDDLEARQVDGRSLQVLRFSPEIGDDRLRITCRAMPYVMGRAFHGLLMEDETKSPVYRPEALRVLQEGTSLPNILSSAIIVIVGKKEEPELVIANRKGRIGGYQQNRWAVSIGEQFISEDHKRGGKEFKKDESFKASIERGLREELLQNDSSIPMNVSIHAFSLENEYNNFALLAIADLCPLSFDQLSKYWYNTEDKAEHTVIAAIPANIKTLKACISSSRLPERYWDTAVDNNKVAFMSGVSDLPPEAHTWQTTSVMRLALAWWYSESR